MALYRVMVAGREEKWQWLDIEADSEREAKIKAIDICNASGWAYAKKSGLLDIEVEAVELLDDRPSKTSDEVWNPEEDTST